MADPAPFRVGWSAGAVQTLEEARTRGEEFGGPQELARVIRRADERLRQDPLAFGEVYRSRGAIDEHLAVLEFLAVDFAIDRERQFVFVRTCTILSHGEH
jgi:hypothetical protein